MNDYQFNRMASMQTAAPCRGESGAFALDQEEEEFFK